MCSSFAKLVVIVNFIACIHCSNLQKIVYAFYENSNEITITEDSNFKPQHMINWTVWGIYKPSINESGFATLEIESNLNFTNEVQSYNVGVLESYLTGELIYSYWYNTVRDFRTTMNQSVIQRVDLFLSENLKWLHKQIHKKKSDPYWHHLKLIYTQIQGIYDGYNKYWSEKFQKLEFLDIMWINSFYDLVDLYDAYGGNKIIGEDHCSVLIKIMPNFSDIYFGHNTWTSYQTMLRIMKKFKLNYSITDSRKLNTVIPGSEVSFSSYPGTVGSLDDFYLISSGLAVTETTNEMFNKTFWRNSLTVESVLQSVRSIIANRLANSGQTWSEIVSLYNSGTYNNQWMIFDYKKFKPGYPPSKNAFWVVEQAPTKSVGDDLTQVLIDKGIWISYNIPYFEIIYDITGYDKMQEKYGNWFSHENCPRAKIFKRDHQKVKDMTSFMDLMRSNDFKKDPFAYCQCNPPFSAAGAIAARNDLNSVNGTFQFQGQSHRPSGATDAKLTNSQLFLKLNFITVSGPSTGTNGMLPIFKWSTSGFNMTPHLSHPDEWNFKPVLLDWSLK